MNKRLILVGPTASGKNVLRDRLSKKGFTFDVSYTTRDIRLEVGEQDGIDYHYISDEKFENMKTNNSFYEKVEYNGTQYGTGKEEWESSDVFIMEPAGIECIKKEDRGSCFVIFINPPVDERIRRMKEVRKWNNQQVLDRIKTDNNKFDGFDKYDIKITTPDF